MRCSIAAAAFALSAGVVVPLHAGAVSGVVRSVTKAGGGAAVAVVYAEPIDSAAPRTPRRVTLAQKNKTFQPRVLAVPIGSTVEFPNNDGLYHNVFSLSTPQPFDLGLYRVFCNIHPQMSAVVVVAPTAYATVAATDGSYMLDLPAGRYRVTALSERAAPVTVEVTSTVGASNAPELTLDESQWAAAQHKNKFGKDYPAAAYKR